ncbi:hypothetical protein CAPTEDRAFT_208285 [Capitella teleta]|nr:hypothetical protein CAPTEDRAFT_208285 [Capitella teleta]|eukprot:ELU18228.1 hypothetical protein CAPTEDRAFT_208285 [Capitella teleta]
MAFLALFLMCVCFVEVSGLHITTDVQVTTDVAATEDQFYFRRNQMLADPFRYFLAKGWTTTQDCFLDLRTNKRYSDEDLLCICLFWGCGINMTAEALDFMFYTSRRLSDSQTSKLLRSRWPAILACVVFGGIGICGNITIIVVISKFMGKKMSATNVLIASIALSDLFSLVICLPTMCYVAIFRNFMGRHWMFKIICTVSYLTHYASFDCSILTMLAIGFER